MKVAVINEVSARARNTEIVAVLKKRDIQYIM